MVQAPMKMPAQNLWTNEGACVSINFNEVINENTGVRSLSVGSSQVILRHCFCRRRCCIAGLSRAETIKGNIRYVGAPIEKKKTAVTIDQYICGKEKEPEDLLLSSNNGIRNAVVSLQNVPSGRKTRLEFSGGEDGSEAMLVHPARGHRAGGWNGGISQ